MVGFSSFFVNLFDFKCPCIAYVFVFCCCFFLTKTTVEKFFENCFIESCFYLDVDFHCFIVVRYSLPSKDSVRLSDRSTLSCWSGLLCILYLVIKLRTLSKSSQETEMR